MACLKIWKSITQIVINISISPGDLFETFYAIIFYLFIYSMKNINHNKVEVFYLIQKIVNAIALIIDYHYRFVLL